MKRSRYYPITDKVSHDMENDKLICGGTSMQGWRPRQEVTYRPLRVFSDDGPWVTIDSERCAHSSAVGLRVTGGAYTGCSGGSRVSGFRDIFVDRRNSMYVK